MKTQFTLSAPLDDRGNFNTQSCLTKSPAQLEFTDDNPRGFIKLRFWNQI